MTNNHRLGWLGGALLAAVVCSRFNGSLVSVSSIQSRRLKGTLVTSQHLQHRGKILPYEIPELAADFCLETTLPRLNYSDCDSSKPFYRVLTFGGYTNQMKIAIVSAIYAFEQNRCFFLEPKRGGEITVKGRPDQSLLDRYTEPIGLPRRSEIVQDAIAAKRVEGLSWSYLWSNLSQRRAKNTNHTIPSLDAYGVEGHRLKMIMLQRMWRPLPEIRHATCQRVESLGLKDDYMAFSVRRGDKHSLEHFDYAKPEQYIEAAEQAVVGMFGGKQPKVFVASDDCSVMSEFRQLRPEWTFVSMCDDPKYRTEGGFHLSSASRWTEEEEDLHFEKFFTELFAMTFAKYWIGVKYTNVSWFVYFMRRAHIHRFQLLETGGIATNIRSENW